MGGGDNKKTTLRQNGAGGVAKMAEQEDPELISSHGHTKITTIYRATISENDLKTSRKDLLQLKI